MIYVDGEREREREREKEREREREREMVSIYGCWLLVVFIISGDCYIKMEREQ